MIYIVDKKRQKSTADRHNQTIKSAGTLSFGRLLSYVKIVVMMISFSLLFSLTVYARGFQGKGFTIDIPEASYYYSPEGTNMTDEMLKSAKIDNPELVIGVYDSSDGVLKYSMRFRYLEEAEAEETLKHVETTQNTDYTFSGTGTVEIAGKGIPVLNGNSIHNEGYKCRFYSFQGDKKVLLADVLYNDEKDGIKDAEQLLQTFKLDESAAGTGLEGAGGTSTAANGTSQGSVSSDDKTTGNANSTEKAGTKSKKSSTADKNASEKEGGALSGILQLREKVSGILNFSEPINILIVLGVIVSIALFVVLVVMIVTRRRNSSLNDMYGMEQPLYNMEPEIGNAGNNMPMEEKASVSKQKKVRNPVVIEEEEIDLTARRDGEELYAGSEENKTKNKSAVKMDDKNDSSEEKKEESLEYYQALKESRQFLQQKRQTESGTNQNSNPLNQDENQASKVLQYQKEMKKRALEEAASAVDSRIMTNNVVPESKNAALNVEAVNGPQTNAKASMKSKSLEEQMQKLIQKEQEKQQAIQKLKEQYEQSKTRKVQQAMQHIEQVEQVHEQRKKEMQPAQPIQQTSSQPVQQVQKQNEQPALNQQQMKPSGIEKLKISTEKIKEEGKKVGAENKIVHVDSAEKRKREAYAAFAKIEQEQAEKLKKKMPVIHTVITKKDNKNTKEHVQEDYSVDGNRRPRRNDDGYNMPQNDRMDRGYASHYDDIFRTQNNPAGQRIEQNRLTEAEAYRQGGYMPRERYPRESMDDYYNELYNTRPPYDPNGYPPMYDREYPYDYQGRMGGYANPYYDDGMYRPDSYAGQGGVPYGPAPYYPNRGAGDSFGRESDWFERANRQDYYKKESNNQWSRSDFRNSEFYDDDDYSYKYPEYRRNESEEGYLDDDFSYYRPYDDDRRR